jgi:hypothetical protein
MEQKMKRKNYYVVVVIVWSIIAIIQSVCCVVNFVDGNLLQGTLNCIFAVSFAFVDGIFLNKAIILHEHNKTCDWLHDIANELKQDLINNIEPFEGFDNE